MEEESVIFGIGSQGATITTTTTTQVLRRSKTYYTPYADIEMLVAEKCWYLEKTINLSKPPEK